MTLKKNIDSNIIAYIESIPDPRKKRGIRYKYADLLLMAIYAVLAGHSSGLEIEYYVELNKDYFKQLINLENIPSHDTFSRILAMSDVLKLAENISNWIKDNFPEICTRIDGNKILHVDGKASRAASKKSEGEAPIYNMNAMYEGESISLYLKKIGDKENEISVLPTYLDLFNLEDTIVTIDAIGCNNNVIKKIQEKKGHYLVPVKNNHKKLKKTIDEKVNELKQTEQYSNLDGAERILKEHGRIETMKIKLISDTSFIYEKLNLDSFYGTISRIGVIDKKTISKENGQEKVSLQTSYVITDLENISAENMLKIKLSHWNIEAAHWLLDVDLNEDKITSRKENSIPSGAVLRRFCLLMRKYNPEFEDKPLKRFLMANEHDIKRIEKILFIDSRNSD